MSISINDQLDQIGTTTGVLRDTDTGGFVVPNGSTSTSPNQRPSVVNNNGLIRYNTDTNTLEAVIAGSYQTFAFTGSISGFLLTSGANTMVGNLGLNVGTSSAPGLYFVNSLSTGFFSPSANVIGITSAGSESVRIDNLGNVGIGKSPSVRLDVTSAGTTASLASTSTNYSLALLGQTTTPSTPVLLGARGNTFVLATNAAANAQFAIDTVGNVGINTTGSAATPAYALDVATSISAGTPSARLNSLNESILRLQSNGTGGNSWDLNSAGGTTSLIAGNFYIRNGSTTALMLDTNGFAYTTTPAALDSSTKVATTAFVTTAIGSAPKGNQGSFKNLKITNNSGSPSTTMTLTADQIILSSNSGGAAQLSTVSLNPNITTSGANGLDTGSVASSQWYYVYVIYNPTSLTTAGLFSLSSTTPTLPSGYTFYARFGAVRTDGSGNFLRTLQYGRITQYVIVSGSNTPNLPVIFSGGSNTFWQTVSISNFVPPTASRIGIGINVNNVGVFIAPNNNYPVYGANTPSTFPFLVCDLLFSGGTGGTWMTLESSNIYYVSSGSGAGLAQAWEDNL